MGIFQEIRDILLEILLKLKHFMWRKIIQIYIFPYEMM